MSNNRNHLRKPLGLRPSLGAKSIIKTERVEDDKLENKSLNQKRPAPESPVKQADLPVIHSSPPPRFIRPKLEQTEEYVHATASTEVRANTSTNTDSGHPKYIESVTFGSDGNSTIETAIINPEPFAGELTFERRQIITTKPFNVRDFIGETNPHEHRMLQSINFRQGFSQFDQPSSSGFFTTHPFQTDETFTRYACHSFFIHFGKVGAYLSYSNTRIARDLSIAQRCPVVHEEVKIILDYSIRLSPTLFVMADDGKVCVGQIDAVSWVNRELIALLNTGHEITGTILGEFRHVLRTHVFYDIRFTTGFCNVSYYLADDDDTVDERIINRKAKMD